MKLEKAKKEYWRRHKIVQKALRIDGKLLVEEKQMLYLRIYRNGLKLHTSICQIMS